MVRDDMNTGMNIRLPYEAVSLSAERVQLSRGGVS